METLTNNETNSGHKHNAHIYNSSFKDHIYDETALSPSEVVIKPLYKCVRDIPYYATKYQDNSIQYMDSFNFATCEPFSQINDKLVESHYWLVQLN